jgi:hypothetical protein
MVIQIVDLIYLYNNLILSVCLCDPQPLDIILETGIIRTTMTRGYAT